MFDILKKNYIYIYLLFFHTDDVKKTSGQGSAADESKTSSARAQNLTRNSSPPYRLMWKKYLQALQCCGKKLDK